VTPYAFPLPRPSIFFQILFTCPPHLATGMIGISLHIQWPLTSQSHGSILKENNWFVPYGSNSMPNIYFLTKYQKWFDNGSKNGLRKSLLLANSRLCCQKFAYIHIYMQSISRTFSYMQAYIHASMR
jgi:hypothetical protein